MRPSPALKFCSNNLQTFFIFFLFLPALAGCGILSGKVELAPSQARSGGLAYRAVIVTPEGAEYQALKAEMEKNSRLLQLADQAPYNRAGLERRALEDVNTAQKVMQSLGWYEGKAGWSLPEAEDAENAEDAAVPLTIVLNLEPGPRFVIGQVRVSWEPSPVLPPAWLQAGLTENLFPVDLAPFGIVSGQTALAAPVLEAVGKLTRAPAERGFPFARVSSARYIKDREKHTLDVFITVDSGPASAMGQVMLVNESEVEPGYLQKLAPWKQGQPWNESLLNEYADTLRQCGLFSTVEVRAGEGSGLPQMLDIKVQVQDGPPRTMSAGINYSTDTAYGANAAWEHRNFFGQGELLRAKLLLSRDKQELAASFRKPQFLRKDQALIGEAALGQENTDAWDRRYVSAAGGVERRLDDVWRAALKGSLESGSIDEGRRGEGWREYQQMGLLFSLWRDSTDNPLNPTRGSRLEWSVGPYSGFYRSPFSTVVARWTGSLYYTPWQSLTLAGRMSLGSMFGASRSAVPGNLRFYAGGGGSVRGYGYQSLGPHDEQGDPAGGQSVQEMSLEARFKVSETFGIVPFVDGGMAYKGSLPRLGSSMAWAVGLGLRYYTGIGPLRLDLATPLDSRKGRSWQMYFSIGQAF